MLKRNLLHNYYDKIGLGIDFTARDIQKEHKEKGLPWELAKAFDHSAPISYLFEKEKYGSLDNLPFHLEKNGILSSRREYQRHDFQYRKAD